MRVGYQESISHAEAGCRPAARAALHPEGPLQSEEGTGLVDRPRADESCLVVAGMGYDGATMADNPELKERIGWIAYVWAVQARWRAEGTPDAALTRHRVADPLSVGDARSQVRP